MADALGHGALRPHDEDVSHPSGVFLRHSSRHSHVWRVDPIYNINQRIASHHLSELVLGQTESLIEELRCF